LDRPWWLSGVVFYAVYSRLGFMPLIFISRSWSLWLFGLLQTFGQSTLSLSGFATLLCLDRATSHRCKAPRFYSIRSSYRRKGRQSYNKKKNQPGRGAVNDFGLSLGFVSQIYVAFVGARSPPAVWALADQLKDNCGRLRYGSRSPCPICSRFHGGCRHGHAHGRRGPRADASTAPGASSRTA